MKVAKPTPRHRPSARAAACRAGQSSRSAISSARSSVARADMRTSSVGPVSIFRGSSSGPMMLRRRISSRPMPRSRAARSSMRSRTQVSTAHGPRYATYVALFDAVSVVVKPSASMRYGPGSITRIIIGYIAALNGNAGYAPWSIVMCTRIPSSVPSSRSAASTSSVSSRAWPATSRCSLRSSIHFTERPRSTAAASTATSSRVGSTFTPKAPPMSCAVTRGSVTGSRASSPSSIRARCTMRTGSRRNVCAIALPGDAGADSPSPIGSSTGGRASAVVAGSTRRLVGRRHRLGLLQEPAPCARAGGRSRPATATPDGGR